MKNMSKILEEVRAISSKKIAENQKQSELGYPKLLEEIKIYASKGKTYCEFGEQKIDEYTKRLLEADGFIVYSTTRPTAATYKQYYDYKIEPVSIWRVSW